MQGELTLQQSVGWNTVLSLSYMTSQGRELPNHIDTNIDNATIGQLNYTIDIPGPALGKKSPLPQGATYTYTAVHIGPAETSLRKHHRITQQCKFQLQRGGAEYRAPHLERDQFWNELYMGTRVGLQPESISL